MDGNASFGHWLQRRRNALRLTQRELAQQVGCAAVTIRKIEADERRPSAQIAQRLADRLELSPAQRSAFLHAARAELCADQLLSPVQLPSLPALHHRLSNLPAQVTPLIGRDQELAVVRTYLTDAGVRLLTLHGPPGIGKTRLSVHGAVDVGDAFDDGCCFVALAPIHDPNLVAAAIVQALGIRASGSQSLVEQLTAYLRTRCVLLVLDNFEQVLAAAPLVGELLAAAPRLKALVTSRAALHLSGEHEYGVPPLALPDLKALPPPAELAGYAAVDLFVQRARAVAPGFALTSANAAAVAEICQRLDGLPLAIELAAARIKLLAPEALLARLNHRLTLLTGGARDLPARQQTLRSTIDWSYDLLDEREQVVFRRLAVFVGGCTLEAAAVVCTGEDDRGTDFLERLAALLDQSLLRQTETADGERRFGMLETIREYALERLEGSGEAEALRRRHAAYYLALAEEAKPQLEQAQQGIWWRRLEQEYDNLRAALAWSKAVADGAETGLRLAAALWRFWDLHGRLSEGRAWLAEFLARVGDSAASAPVRVEALFGAGILAQFQSDYVAARASFIASLAIARELGEEWSMTQSLEQLGHIAQYQGDYATELPRLEESLATWRVVGNKAGITEALNWLGTIAWYQGDYAAARSQFEESLALQRELGDEVGAAWNLMNLGNLARAEGDYAQAETLYAVGLALTQRLGHTVGIVWSLHHCGELARYQGDYMRAAVLYEESLAIAREIGYTSAVASMLNRLGEVAQAQGNYVRATALHRESLIVFRDLGQKRDMLLCLEGLAWAAEAEAQGERAAVLYGIVAALREATGALLPPLDRMNYAHSVERVRAALGAAPFAAAWDVGRGLSLEQALAYALDTGRKGRSQIAFGQSLP
jgi:predicted ATPase/transcriptional regulator with XRE-family HTH domain